MINCLFPDHQWYTLDALQVNSAIQTPATTVIRSSERPRPTNDSQPQNPMSRDLQNILNNHAVKCDLTDHHYKISDIFSIFCQSARIYGILNILLAQVVALLVKRIKLLHALPCMLALFKKHFRERRVISGRPVALRFAQYMMYMFPLALFRVC